MRSVCLLEGPENDQNAMEWDMEQGMMDKGITCQRV